MAKNRTVKKARQAATDLRPVTKLRDPGDIVAMIPYLLGFTPVDSIVVISLEGPRRRFGPCLRLDLVDEVSDAVVLVNHVSAIIEHHCFGRVVAVCFSTRPDVAGAVMTTLHQKLESQGVTLTESLRADGERWWSYQCDDELCCDPRGTLYDVETARVAAEAVLAGMSRVESRDALRRQFEPAATQASLTVAATCRALACLPVSEQPSRWSPERLRKALTRAVQQPQEVSPDDLAGLLMAVQEVSRRDVAWTMIDRENANDHFVLWREVMTVAPDELMAPAGSLTGFAAWLTGRGVLAAHAADRVTQVAPAYSMGLLLHQVLEATLDPASWDDVSAR